MMKEKKKTLIRRKLIDDSNFAVFIDKYIATWALRIYIFF